MKVIQLAAICFVGLVAAQYQQQAPVQQAPPPAGGAAPPPPGPGGVPPPVGGVPPVGPGMMGPGMMGPGMIPPMMGGMIPPFFPPFFPPFLGFPWLGLGLGFGGLGRFGLGFGGIRRFGKRSTFEAPEDVRCFISTKTKTIDCSDGAGQRIACAVEPNLGFFDVKLNLTDLSITEKFTPTSGEMFSLLSPKSALVQMQNGQGLVGFLTPEMLANGKYTFIDPITQEHILLSFYFDVTTNEPGFLVKDKICYNGIVDMLTTNIRTVKFDLVVV